MSRTKLLTVFLIAVLALCLQLARADIYMHSPRGSNDRNCERDANRRNANRLFDSQNNAAGGYACPRAVGGPEVKTPKMFYYEGSEVHIEWTSQHSCGEHNNYCNIIIQYMCNDTVVGNHSVYGDYYAVRDGIPKTANDDAADTVTENDYYNLVYGVHEQYENYYKCKNRDRNMGLFIGDRRPGSKAINTRQNEGGTRYGFECVEERDYYPYWADSPWVDVAVFTDNTTLCDFYQQNSQNVAPKGECWSKDGTTFLRYNNIKQCIESNIGKWVEKPAKGVDAPLCLSNNLIAVRDNHLGNTQDGNMAHFKWKVPFLDEMPKDANGKIHHENCVIRIRYNISTTEMPFFTDAKSNFNYNNPSASKTPITQDPWDTWGYDTELHLAVNTDQYGRVFQDRSYVFEIRKRPTDVPKYTKIYNLNVRGKRGNIVQTFPSTEYDFVPSDLTVRSEDYIHFQWTGSDYNPNRTPNNAEGGPVDKAQGGYRADRSNIVQLDVAGMNVPRNFTFNTMFLNENGKADKELIHRLAFLNQNIYDNTTCLSKAQLKQKYKTDTASMELDDKNCGKLANTPTGPYFNGGLVRMRASGKFYYFSTRNNNFSNRGQKGIITVTGGRFSSANSNTMGIMALLSVLLACLMFLL